jgi:hypothetical protein
MAFSSFVGMPFLVGAGTVFDIDSGFGISHLFFVLLRGLGLGIKQIIHFKSA